MRVKRFSRLTLACAISSVVAGAMASTALAQSVQVQAENFTAQGGTYADGQPQAVSTYSVNGVQAINYVNRGDYVEYEVNIAEAGVYTVQYLIGTAVPSGAEVELSVKTGNTWQSQGTTTVPTGGWDNFQPLDGAHEITLPAGNVSIRLTGSGANDWQWNLDEFALTLTQSEVEPETPSDIARRRKTITR